MFLELALKKTKSQIFSEEELMLNWNERDKGKWNWLCKVIPNMILRNYS